MISRTIERQLDGTKTSDGAGVSLTRFLHGPYLQERLDPYLMLDAFGSDDPNQYIAGFPNHPHRGFETITYMLEGRMLHNDSSGNEGLLENGDFQWMCAGKGVIHSEMPQQVSGRMAGFQLWLNLPAQDKMCEPWYRDIQGAEVPVHNLDGGGLVRVVAGSAFGITGAMQRPITEPLYLDVELPAGATLEHEIPVGHNAFVQLYEGAIELEGVSINKPQLIILDNNPAATGVKITATSASRYLIIAGKPLNEPIEQYGPFVMNTKEQIYQAVQDFRNGRLG